MSIKTSSIRRRANTFRVKNKSPTGGGRPSAASFPLTAAPRLSTKRPRTEPGRRFRLRLADGGDHAASQLVHCQRVQPVSARKRIERFRLRPGRMDPGGRIRQREPGLFRASIFPLPVPRTPAWTAPSVRKISISGTTACRGRYCLPKHGCARKVSANPPTSSPPACQPTTFSSRRIR